MKIEVSKEDFMRLVEEALTEERAYQRLETMGLGSLPIMLDCSSLKMTGLLDYIIEKADISEKFYEDIRDQRSIVDITNKWYEKISSMM